MTYNTWYTDTYEPILQLANWNDLTADVEKKVIGVFAWMPQTIMSVRNAGGQFKHQLYSAQSIRDALGLVKESFDRIRNFTLENFEVSEHKSDVEALCLTLFPMFGSVGASKYLHFSCPKLLPIWDRQIRVDSGCEDSAAGYVNFVRLFKEELEDGQNRRAAFQKYPSNLVRGWDIVRMERRTRRAEQTAARDRVKKRGA